VISNRFVQANPQAHYCSSRRHPTLKLLDAMEKLLFQIRNQWIIIIHVVLLTSVADTRGQFGCNCSTWKQPRCPLLRAFSQRAHYVGIEKASAVVFNEACGPPMCVPDHSLGFVTTW